MKLESHSRYNRQITLLGKIAQENITEAKIAIIGCGALGSTSADLLARAGFNLRLIDRDLVEESNFQRTRYNENQTNEPKATALKEILQEANSTIEIEAEVEDFNPFTAQRFVKNCDLIVDGTDNMLTRYLINETSIEKKIPYIYGSAIATEGMMGLFIPDYICFRCVFPRVPAAASLDTCQSTGVLNSTVSIVAAMQTATAIKLIGGTEKIEDRLLHFDLEENNFSFMQMKKNPECPACKGQYEFLKSRENLIITQLCDGIQISPKKRAYIDFSKLKIEKNADHFSFINYRNHEISLFKNGRMIIHGLKDKNQAKSIYSEIVGI